VYEINMQESEDVFKQAWQMAGKQLEAQGQGAVNWLRAHLQPPFLEHLSFRLGNQLFFVRIEGEGLDAPGNRIGLNNIAEGCRGHACLMPMRLRDNQWVPELPGWGLLDAHTGRPLDPPTLITDDPIDMTDWELLDFAVQVVKDMLVGDGRELMSWSNDPQINPSIWFVGEQGPEWVVVRTTRYPEMEAPMPENWQTIVNECARLSSIGHFASVAVACEDTLDEGNQLWRGHGLVVRYQGLQRRT